VGILSFNKNPLSLFLKFNNKNLFFQPVFSNIINFKLHLWFGTGMNLKSEEAACLLKGFLSIAEIDGTIIHELEFIIGFIFETMRNSQESKLKIKEIIEEEFDIQQARPILENKKVKAFFFNISVMIACLDSLSNDEMDVLNSYADEFDYPKHELQVLLKNVLNELGDTDKSFIINSISNIIKGYVNYFQDRETSGEAYFALRQLFCLTNGRFNDLIAFISGYFNPPGKPGYAESVVGSFDQKTINHIVENINKEGLYIFPEKLADDLCDNLLAFSLNTPSHPIGTPDDNTILYNQDLPVSVKYDFNLQSLLEDKTVQKLVTDPVFFAIAQSYLGDMPIFDFSAMWWATPSLSGKPSQEAAQFYHFDMDRFKFIKFFVYLTDVGPDNGPHCYVRGSHNRKPVKLLSDGPLSDNIIGQFYKQEDILQVTAPKGTIFAADTRGFHKGKPLESGHRLIFQIEFATDLFGQNYTPVKITENFAPQTLDFMKRHKYTFSNFV
jgi:hypothetical protein